MQITEMGHQARVAARQLARATTLQKNSALLALAVQLETRQADVLRANAIDLAAAQAAGLSPALLDRLTLNPARPRRHGR